MRITAKPTLQQFDSAFARRKRKRQSWSMMATEHSLIPVRCVFAAGAFLAGRCALFGQAPTIDTPDKLWREFQAEKPELEIETIRTWHDDQAEFQTLRFTAERESNGRVRVFAIRGAPSHGHQLPGILHIHGGGQTASLDWVRFWARRGYVCLSYDFTGPWAGRKDVTDWGPIKQANLAEANGGLQVKPTPRASSWYHWAVVARRALTVLSYHPQVDRDRLGVFGISIGGTLCWLVAGTDERVKTAVAVYGCGYSFDKRKTVWGFPDPDRNLMLFNHALAPEAYAPLIRRPLLLLDGTNDFHGWMDNAYEIVSQVRSPTRLALSPRFNHHIDEAQGEDLPAWMDWQLRDGRPFPAEPKLDLRLDRDGDPLANVRPAEESQVTRVDVFYTLGEKPPPNRFWRRAKALQSNRYWQAKLPVLQLQLPLRCFANVYYQSGICLSSNLARAIPERLGAARASLTWSAAPAAELDQPGAPFVFARANTDPNAFPRYFLRSNDPERPDAVCLNPAVFGKHIDFGIVSHYVGDAGYAGRDGQSLRFEYRGEFLTDGPWSPSATPGPNNRPPELTVQVTVHEWTPRAKSYTARVAIKEATTGWQAVRLSASNFLATDGMRLPNWRELDKIEIRGIASRSNPPRFSRFRWTAQ
jgi:dienelactone hydrolase